MLLDQARKEAIREMIAETIVNEMRQNSAYDVFMEIDSDKDDEVNPKELLEFLLSKGVHAKPDEIMSFLKQADLNHNGTLDLIEFFNYLQKQTMTRIDYFKKYPKLERASIEEQAIGVAGQASSYSDDQIIDEIEEKIFEYMISKKIKILKLHEMMDKDKNQSIGRPEFRNFFKNRIGIELTRKDLDVIFHRFDKDNDGSISVKEFVGHLKEAINKRKSLKYYLTFYFTCLIHFSNFKGISDHQWLVKYPLRSKIYSYS